MYDNFQIVVSPNIVVSPKTWQNCETVVKNGFLVALQYQNCVTVAQKSWAPGGGTVMDLKGPNALL